MRVPKITFRVESVSPPFDGDQRVEVKFDLIIRIGDTEIVSRVRRCFPAAEGAMMEVGETWDADFIKRGARS